MKYYESAFLVYLLLINALAVIVCYFDKHRAKIGGWRVSEKSLFLFCIFGGSVGMYSAMKLIRHKTQKKKFMIGIPVIIILQAVIVIALYYSEHKKLGG